MKTPLILLSLLLSVSASAAGKRAPAPVPSATASPLPTPAVSPSPALAAGLFVTLGSDLGPTLDRAFASRALALMNQAYSSGCLRAGIEAHRFASLNTVFDLSPKTSAEAAQEYLGGAPYALDLRWYYKGASRVIGYTYNFRDDDWSGGASETRIWSNTKYIGPGTESSYAAHLSHELSHQARAGGFVHYTVFSGSFPYDVGDIMEGCLR